MISTQIPKMQSIQMDFIKIQKVQSAKPQIEKMLAENSDYKIFEAQKLETVSKKNQQKKSLLKKTLSKSH